MNPPAIIADFECKCGEGPLWHPEENRLYWVDIPRGRLFRYDCASGQSECCFESAKELGGFTLQHDGSLLLFFENGAVRAWRDGIVGTVLEKIPDERETRFNDVAADPEGRVFCGTMPTTERGGRLYRLDTDGALTLLLEGLGCPNGIGFTPDLKRMYFTDSGAQTIWLFDYDRASGAIENQRVFLRQPEGGGSPDGMTVDAEGCVWSAIWGGGCIIRVTPAGGEIERFHVPAQKASSVTFGGADYSDLYITTAGGDERITEGAGAGALFCMRPGVCGIPEFRSRVNTPG
jgi:D-xylonolactonase